METLPVVLSASLVAEIVALSVLFGLLPSRTRPELFFGVTVAPGFRTGVEAGRTLRGYRRQIGLHAALAFGFGAAMAIVGRPEAALVAPFWLIGAGAVTLLRARRRVLPHAVAPTTLREAALSPRRRVLPGGIWGQLGPFAMLGAAGAVLQGLSARIPARFVVHWNLHGEPDRWASRSFVGLNGPLLVGALVCLMLGAASYGIARFSRTVDAAGPRALKEQRFRATVLGVLLSLAYVVAALFGGIALLLPLSGGSQQGGDLAAGSGGLRFLWLLLLVGPVMLVSLALVVVRLDRGTAEQVSGDGPPMGDRTRDEHWRWGIVYVNADDPSLFVEERMGLGYTLNLGNRWSWAVLGVLLALVGAVVAVARAG